MSSTDSKGLNRRTALKLAGFTAGAAVLRSPSRASANHRASCLRTRLSSEFGLRVPLVSAGMAFVSLSDLTTAVSNAGAIGVYGVGGEGAGPAGVDVVNARLKSIARNARGPYGVDFILANTPGGPFTTPDLIAVAIDHRVPIVAFHWDVPDPDWVTRLHEVGTTVWVQTGDVNVALRAVAAGADGIIAQGRSAGGHNKNSTIATLDVVRRMRRALPREIFILAAGGISDGRSLVRAIRAGADGGWAGTVFAASAESYAHVDYKARLVAAQGPSATQFTTVFGPEWPGQPQRVLKNRATAEPNSTTPRFIGDTLLAPGVLNAPYQMPKHSAIVPTRDTKGDLEEMDMPAGSESVRAVRKVRPAASIVEDFIDEGREACERDDDDDRHDDDRSRND